jgi:FKBP-type peptidyl-prolyl cis-trans isomerase
MPSMRGALLIIAACLALVFAGCGDDDSSTTSASGDETAPAQQTESTQPAESSKEKTKPKVTVPKGAPPKQLVTKDLETGTGPAAKAGDEVTVQYVGVGYDSKKEFDSSWSRNEPFPFNLGAGEVIPGWDQGIQGMKVGGRRELVIPPNLAYGPAGSPPVIGQNETLIFVVDLEAVK